MESEPRTQTEPFPQSHEDISEAADLCDMHCHLDFARNGRELAAQAERASLSAFSTTVDPRDYAQAQDALAPWPCIRVGLGLHPWWLASGSCDDEAVRLFEAQAPRVRLIGEVGLDFAPRFAHSIDWQVAVYRRLMQACSGGGRLFSIHAVRSVSTVLDILEETGAHRGSRVILHWFSGSSEELTRAVKLGCSFSVGSRMLATKRGRAYARSLPLSRLLLETDLPDDLTEHFSFDRWHSNLEQAFLALATARGIEGKLGQEELRAQVNRNSREAFAIAIED